MGRFEARKEVFASLAGIEMCLKWLRWLEMGRPLAKAGARLFLNFSAPRQSLSLSASLSLVGLPVGGGLPLHACINSTSSRSPFICTQVSKHQTFHITSSIRREDRLHETKERNPFMPSSKKPNNQSDTTYVVSSVPIYPKGDRERSNTDHMSPISVVKFQTFRIPD